MFVCTYCILLLHIHDSYNYQKSKYFRSKFEIFTTIYNSLHNCNWLKSLYNVILTHTPTLTHIYSLAPKHTHYTPGELLHYIHDYNYNLHNNDLMQYFALMHSMTWQWTQVLICMLKPTVVRLLFDPIFWQLTTAKTHESLTMWKVLHNYMCYCSSNFEWCLICL